MAESWSTSRQSIVVSEYAFTFASDRGSIVPSARRTYLERSGITSAYILVADSRWTICSRYDPYHTDRIARLKAILFGKTAVNCICEKTTGLVSCRLSAVDNNGPVVLEYPKYYNENTIPPDFDVVFRIYSAAELDWSSLVLSITTSSGTHKSYGHGDLTIINITDEISEIRLVPQDLLTMIGDTINVKVFVQDIYNRPLDLNW